METKVVRITYRENTTTKNWMDKFLKPQEQSGFIRDAVATKIKAIIKAKKSVQVG